MLTFYTVHKWLRSIVRGMMMTEKNQTSLRKKHIPVPLRPSQIWRGLTWDGTVALPLTVQQQIVKQHTLTWNCAMRYTEHNITLGERARRTHSKETRNGNQTRSWASASLTFLSVKHCTSCPTVPSQGTLSNGGEFGWGRNCYEYTDSHYKLLHRTKFTMSLPPRNSRYHKQHPILTPSATHTHVTLLRSNPLPPEGVSTLT